MIKTILTTLACATLLLAGCSSDSGSEQAVDTAAAMADVELNGAPFTIAGITFTPPSDWTDLGASGMRQANYTFGPSGDDTDSAVVAVYYFGAASGGATQANITRWVSQMSAADGSNPMDAAEHSTMTVDGMTITTVSLPGTYAASMGGPMMSGGSVAKEGYFLSAAVVEGPEGSVFFKLTGPENTAGAMNAAFMAALAQLKKN